MSVCAIENLLRALSGVGVSAFVAVAAFLVLLVSGHPIGMAAAVAVEAFRDG